MSNAINDHLVDDKELNEYLSGDTPYSRRYDALASDDVPVELDRLVLANATEGSVTPITAATSQRVVGRRRVNSLGYWMHVGVPVALAASFVLAISIVLDRGASRNASVIGSMEVQSQATTPALEIPAEPANDIPARTDAARPNAVIVGDLAQLSKQDAEASSRKKLAENSSAESRTRQRALAIAERTQSKAQDKGVAVDAIIHEEAAQPNAPVAAAPAAAVSADPSAKTDASAGIVSNTTAAETDKRASATRNDSALKLEEVIVTAQGRPGASVGPRSSIPSANFDEHEPSDAELAKERREANPVNWVAYIRELRADGKARAADREWQRFVKAYPNFLVDESDTARPKKK